MSNVDYPNPNCLTDEPLQDYVFLDLIQTKNPTQSELFHNIQEKAVLLFGERGRYLRNSPNCAEDEVKRLLEFGWVQRNMFRLQITDKGKERLRYINTRWFISSAA